MADYLAVHLAGQSVALMEHNWVDLTANHWVHLKAAQLVDKLVDVTVGHLVLHLVVLWVDLMVAESGLKLVVPSVVHLVCY